MAGDTGCTFFSDLIALEGCEDLAASPLQNEHVVAFFGRFRFTDKGACLCYIFPSSRQIQKQGGDSVSVVFPYSETETAQRQTPAHAFILIKRTSPPIPE